MWSPVFASLRKHKITEIMSNPLWWLIAREVMAMFFHIKSSWSEGAAILDSEGNAVVEYSYDAWGKLWETTGSMATTLGVHNPLRYRGYVYDPEINLYYLRSRYYDPQLGRFINADAYASTGTGLLGYHMFAYCNNNPIDGYDPCGTCNHRLDFWNDCDECDSSKDKGITLTKGKYFSVNLWVLNITLSVDVAVDTKGNIQPLLGITKDLNASGKLSFSKGDTLGVYFVPDTSYLYKTTCNTYNIGGGCSIPVPPMPIAAGGAISLVANSDGDMGFVAAYGASTMSASGGEWHVGVVDTYPLLPQINISRAAKYLLERCVSMW